MLRTLTETSIFIALLKILAIRYLYLERWCDGIYNDSQTCRLMGKVGRIIKASFRYSFLGKITEIKEKENIAFLVDSKFLRWALHSYRLRKDNMALYSNTSVLTNSVKNAKKEIFLSAAKTTSIIIISAIITNVVLSFILQRQIRLWGWYLRGLWFFVAIIGLFSNINLPALKNSSVILRKFRLV